jgi:hypothetical protein
VREVVKCLVKKENYQRKAEAAKYTMRKVSAVEARLLLSCFGLKKPAVPRTQGNLIGDSRTIAVPTPEKIEVEYLGKPSTPYSCPFR